MIRSFLFVPGDSERKQQKALGSDADALILDLEDSVAPAQLPAARARVGEILRTRATREGPTDTARPRATGAARQQLWVRVNAPSSGLMSDDLDAIFAKGACPDGVVLPKVSTPAEICQVARQLAALEERSGSHRGTVRILVIATETPLALLSLPQYPSVLAGDAATAQRLTGLTWGSEDLSTSLGVRGKFDESGALTFTFQLARSYCQLTAAALGVQAIDGVYVDFRNAQGFQRELDAARRDGFSGKLAIHPDQVAAINAAFSPTEAELEHARKIVEAFAAAPGAGVVNLNGQMVDRPHLVQAERILALAR
jgi:citrate lyase subunit beta/citryl-CoA lyase